MALRLEGKHCFVTGAGQGIGRAIALAFAEEGATVVAASRTSSKLADLPKLHGAITPVRLDVTDGPAVDEIVAAAGAVDVLVNCAGFVHSGTVLETSDEDWATSFDQNVTSAFRTTRAVLPGMLERGRGAIVNIASVASHLTGVANRAAYGASKAAMIGLTKAVARDFIRSGVRCNALCPGTTDSPSLNDRMRQSGDIDRMRREFTERQPIGRLGSVEEMAAAAVYLASDETSFMTGSVLVIDGGQTL